MEKGVPREYAAIDFVMTISVSQIGLQLNIEGDFDGILE